MLIHVECVRMPRFQFNLLRIGDSFGLKPVKWTSATCRLNFKCTFFVTKQDMHYAGDANV